MEIALEMLQNAVLRLARDGSVKERLCRAWLEQLASLDVATLPEPCRAEFRELSAALTREPPVTNEPVVWATVRKMSIAEAGRAAERIVALYGSVARELHRAAVPRAGHAGAQVVPLFAVEA